ncbi:sugar ABC transporter substrate-binding protein [Paenarthrobacter sp. NPDC089714]|uniref:sugar ABC transporter substrate-binding protein n=1 Tax=Paenarthrobacter sp. NPDC089714 TaxID=3364377 RepID=UPI0038025D34
MTSPNTITRMGIATALGLAATLSFTACASTTPSNGSSAGGATIGYAGSKLTDPFQIALTKATQNEATKQGVNLLPPTNANADPAKQVTDIQTTLAKSPKSLIINPVDAKAIVPAIQKANNQKVPVITVDQAPESGNVAMIVRADNLAMGKQACEQIGKALSGKGTVLDLQGDLSSTNGRERSQGFADCLKSEFPNMTVVQKPTNWEMDKATNAAQTLLSSSSIDGIFMASDFFVPGIQKVLQDLNKWQPVGTPGHVALVGIDGTSDALKLIRDGYQDATIAQPLNDYAKYSIQYANEAATGKTFSEGPTDHGSTITKNSAGQLADSLPSPVVTKANADDKTLWANQ